MNDTVVVDVHVMPTARQRLHMLLDATVQHGASLTLYAADYVGDLKRDFLRWVDARPEYALKVSETKVVTDIGWQRLIMADQPHRGHLRSFSIYFPFVQTTVLSAEVV